MEIKGVFNNTSFQFKDEIPVVLERFKEENELFNQSNLLFLEEKYINECENFSKIIDKFKMKKFDDCLLIYRNNQLESLKDFSKEVELFGNVISENNINGLNKNDLKTSVKHFGEYEDSPKVKYTQNIYILLFLANITEYENNNFTFKANIEKEEIAESISFNTIHSFDLFAIYSWIVQSKNNLQTRLRIIREFIVRKGSFKLSESDLNSAKSTFNRIIMEETEKYFAQVNMLKDDFLNLSKRVQSSYQSLHLKFLGWSSSIALFIYGELLDENSENLYKKLFLSTTEKSFLFLIIFIFSILIIWSIFLKEMNENKNEFEKIKEFYTKQLFFVEEDISLFIDSPKISFFYKLFFSLLLIVLILRLSVFFI